MRRIVLPQASSIVLPDIGNQHIAMQKDTALARAIAVPHPRTLSRGQKQCGAIAWALAMQREVMLFDELASSL